MLITQAGKNRSQVAREIGQIPESFNKKVINGPLRADLMPALAKSLGVTLEHLLTGADDQLEHVAAILAGAREKIMDLVGKRDRLLQDRASPEPQYKPPPPESPIAATVAAVGLAEDPIPANAPPQAPPMAPQLPPAPREEVPFPAAEAEPEPDPAPVKPQCGLTGGCLRKDDCVPFGACQALQAAGGAPPTPQGKSKIPAPTIGLHPQMNHDPRQKGVGQTQSGTFRVQ